MLKNGHVPAGLTHWQKPTPEEADFAIVSIRTPAGHYQPISLQWSPYTATDAREVSLAGGDPTESSTNRSYKGYAITQRIAFTGNND